MGKGECFVTRSVSNLMSRSSRSSSVSSPSFAASRALAGTRRCFASRPLRMCGTRTSRFVTHRSCATTWSSSPYTWQAHPDAKLFRDASFPLYNELSLLCEGIIATGIHALGIGGPLRRCGSASTQARPSAAFDLMSDIARATEDPIIPGPAPLSRPATPEAEAQVLGAASGTDVQASAGTKVSQLVPSEHAASVNTHAAFGFVPWPRCRGANLDEQALPRF
jgi:hypothetical protein